MFQQEDKVDFIKAMMKETSDHESKGHWEVVPRSEKPFNVKTILAIWAFKRKRYPDGRIWKHKARLCAHGDMQTYGVNYWDTYAPTVNWISIRFILIIAQALELNTQAIDITLAFPQADLEVSVYMELPAGMELAGKSRTSSQFVLNLRKSLYGFTQAIDFTLAFPKANLEVPVYMELPAGIELAGKSGDSSRYVLKLKKTLYGLKQASLNW